MARILFLLEEAPDPYNIRANMVYRLIRKLADQDHDVILVTEFKEEQELPPPHRKIEILRPFQRWSLSETLQALPILASLKPDILHFVLLRDHGWRGLLSSRNYLPQILSMVQPQLRVLSILDWPTSAKFNFSLRELLDGADAVTVASSHQAARAREYIPLHKLGRVETLPLHDLLSEAEIANEVENPFEQYILSPLSLDRIQNIQFLLDQVKNLMLKNESWGWVIAGGWGNLPPLERKRIREFLRKNSLEERFFVSGPLKESETHLLAMGAKRMILTGIPFGSFEFSYYNHLARVYRIPSYQAQGPTAESLKDNERDSSNFLSRLYQRIDLSKNPRHDYPY